MPRAEQGRFDETFDVVRDRTIQGAVTDGATVRSGCTLAIQGAAAGHFTIESDAILMVQGTLSGTCDNYGTVLVAGVITSELPSTGRVAVAAGTLLTQDGTLILRPTGALEAVSDGENVQIDASSTGYLAFDREEGVFRPLRT
jgi:hypothetical protein